MSSKLLIQLSITMLIALILLVFYYFFFSSDNTFIKEDKVDIDNQINNKIVDLKYTANDIDGNSYIINSEYGEISDLDSNELKLEGVKAIIEIKNSESVIIFSDYANYKEMLSPNSVIVIHDIVSTAFPELNEVWNELCSNFPSKAIVKEFVSDSAPIKLGIGAVYMPGD